MLSSSWENFPHTVVEALAAGTPVIATSAGGVAEVVRDGENGLLVPSAMPRRSPRAIALTSTMRLARRLRAAAARSVADYAPRAGLRRARADARGVRRRVRRATGPLRRADALPAAAVAEPRAEVRRARRELDVRVLASARAGLADAATATFTLVPPLRVAARRARVLARAAARASRAPARVSARRDRRARPRTTRAAALVARRLAHVPARVVVEVHGDWRTSTRLYGSPARRAAEPRRRRGRRDWRCRRADAVRTVSPFTAVARARARGRAGRRLPRLHGSRALRRAPPAPLPERPAALFVGVLEATRTSTGSPRRGGSSRRSVPGGDAAHRRQRHARRRRGGARAQPARAGTSSFRRRRSRGARRRDGARPAVALGGDGPRARRGVLPRSRRRRHARRRRSRISSSDGVRAARAARTTRRRSPTRSSGCSPTARSPSGSAAARAALRRRGSRRPRSTRAACGSSSRESSSS